jgi:hypothetical protein
MAVLLLLVTMALLAAVPPTRISRFSVCLLAGFWLCMQLGAAPESRLRLSLS